MPTTTSHPLLAKELATYAAAWQALLKEEDPRKLRDCFTSNGELMNYVYLPLAYAEELVADARTLSIQSAMVAAPSDGRTVFSTVLFGIDEDNQPTSGYYLAGVAPQRARVVVVAPTTPDVSFEVVPEKYAGSLVEHWHAQSLETLSVAMFTSKEGALRSYTHEVTDFRGAIAAAKESGEPDAALWLNFGLHKSDDPALDPPMPFATVMCLNALPTEDKQGTIVLDPALRYYDLSKPCPPVCHRIGVPSNA